jgi:hypothetical protein
MLKEVKDSLVLPIVSASVLNTITVLIGILINYARLNDFRCHMEECFDEVERRFDKLDQRFGAFDRRFQQMLDAKPRHPEER